MKQWGKIALIIMVLLAPGLAVGATALWNPPTLNEDGTPLTDLSGFNFYEVTGGNRVKVNTALIPTSLCIGTPSLCTYAIPGSVTKGDSFVVTAVDSTGSESVDSNTATYMVKPKAPASLIIKP